MRNGTLLPLVRTLPAAAGTSFDVDVPSMSYEQHERGIHAL
jgi:hypothetical protein